jgi:cytochrome d ubiquinol oxidase subunit II
VAFSVASVVGSLLVGVALGNLARGVPLDARHEIESGFFDLLHPYALLVGLTTLALFAMHGAIYVVMKTEGTLQTRARGWVRRTIAAFVVCYLATSVATFFSMPHMVEPFERFPIFLAIPVLTLLAVANIPREIHHGRELRAFLTSCATTVGLLALFGLGMYPRLVYSQPHPERSLTIYNAASSPQTLETMAIIAALGMPLVVGYTVAVYRIFRGKVKVTPHSY